MASKATTVSAPTPNGEVDVRVSSPDRVMFPAHDGPALTKLDVVQYLLLAAPRMLKELAGRPVTLERYPEGLVTGDGEPAERFYSKNPPRGLPAHARTVTCTYPSGRQHEQLIIDDAATLVWTAQMSTLVYHPWPVDSSDPHYPNEARWDLDPHGSASFADIVSVALVLREVLHTVGLAPRVKVSGSRGVHIVADILPEYDFYDVRHAVIAVARETVRRCDGLATLEWWKESRGNQVFIDYNQACRDRTLAGAYSPRANSAAAVSVPVSWENLKSVGPQDFTIHNAPEWLALPDPWADGRRGRSIDDALGWWRRDRDAGQGELPYPVDYPKMPGEPLRVQPSRKATAKKAAVRKAAPKKPVAKKATTTRTVSKTPRDQPVSPDHQG